MIHGVLFPMGGDAQTGDGRRWRINRDLERVINEGWASLRGQIPENLGRLKLFVRAQDPPYGIEYHPRKLETPMGAWTRGWYYGPDGYRRSWTGVMLDTSAIDGIHHGLSGFLQDREGQRQPIEHTRHRDKFVRMLANERTGFGIEHHIFDAPNWVRRHVSEDRFRRFMAICAEYGYAENGPTSQPRSTTVKEGNWDRSGNYIDNRGVVTSWAAMDGLFPMLPIIHDKALVRACIEGASYAPPQWVVTITKLREVVG